MMKQAVRVGWSCSLGVAVVLTTATLWLGASDLRAQSIGKEEAARWTRGVIPLPREMVIDRKVVVAGPRIAITLMPDAGLLEREAAAELADALARKTGVKIAVGAQGDGKDAIEIVLGRCAKDGKLASRAVPGATRLFTLPNSDQAYRIVPLGDRTLALAGTQPQGVYYAVKTLKQLISSAPSSAEGQAAVPMADVTDWPDLAERGLWGGNVNEDIEWMADRKMNLVETHVGLSVEPDGRATAVVPEGLLARAQRHAVNLVPIITHLEQLPPVVFVRYPQLKAIVSGETARRCTAGVQPVCFSQPEIEKILADWLTCLGRYPEVTDVNVWLAEDNLPCECKKCAAVNSYVLQTQTILRAWNTAKRIRPDLRLRILLADGTYHSTAQVLATAPREVGITYYNSGGTYDSSRRPMIYPLLEKYATEGGWLGCYPQLTASWRGICPWSGPQFIKARMSEFASKRLQCLCGYATPSNRFYEFNITAAAEWSWNAAGRSERDFAVAWATRQGLADPEMAADWAVALGPVGWDVHGGGALCAWCYYGAAGMFDPGKPPQLGSGVFTYFPTKEHFDADLTVCDRAMILARKLKSPAMIEETRVTRGLVELLKGLYLFAEATAPREKMTPDDRRRAADALALADRARQEARDGLIAWAKTVNPRIVVPPGYSANTSSGDRFVDTMNCLQRVVTEAGDVAARLNIPDPGRARRIQLTPVTPPSK